LDYQKKNRFALHVCVNCVYAPCFSKTTPEYCPHDTVSLFAKWKKVTHKKKREIIEVAECREEEDQKMRALV